MIFDWFKKKRVVLTGPRAKIWMMTTSSTVMCVPEVLVTIQVPKGYMNDARQTEARVCTIKSREKD